VGFWVADFEVNVLSRAGFPVVLPAAPDDVTSSFSLDVLSVVNLDPAATLDGFAAKVFEDLGYTVGDSSSYMPDFDFIVPLLWTLCLSFFFLGTLACILISVTERLEAEGTS
jgi:hypothetical protein